MFRMTRLASAMAAASLTAIPAYAQTSNELEPVIVTATRVEQKLSDVIPSATVITREEIERAQAPTFVDLIQGQPGVEIGRNGGPGTVSSIFMRGQASTNVAVFIDGVPVQRDSYGNLKLVDIPPSQIEKIEILRGNMGAIYGEAAVGGAIHIFTRSGTGASGPTASVSYGSRNTSDLTAGYNLNGDDYKLGFSVQRYETDGYSAMNPSQNPTTVNSDDDAFERESIFLNGEKTINDQVAIGFRANRIEADVDYDRNYSWADDSDDAHNSRQESSDLTAYSRINLSPDWSSRISITQSDFENREFQNNILETYGNFEGDQLGVQWSNSYKIGSGNASFGIDITDAEFETNGSIYKRDSSGYYLGYSDRFDQLDYQANIRRDEVKDKTASINESANTWLLGLGYLLNNQTKLTGLISTSFRAPSTGELSTTSSLKPEEHKSYEIGIDHTINAGTFKATFFNNDSSNSIMYNDGTYEYENIDMKNKGFELSLHGTTAGWNYKLSAVTQDPKNAQSGETLGRRAKKYGSMDLTKTAIGVDWSANLLWSANRKDLNNPADSKFNNSYTVVNLTAAKKLTPEWTARLKIENAFDEDYQLAYGYDAVPRGVFLSINYQPK